MAETIELPDFIADLNDYTEHINMMVYADPGDGKTVLAGSARTLILATEHGTVSAARQGAGKLGAQMVDCVNDWDRFVQAIDWVKDNAGKPNFPFDWLAIDTATELQELIKRDIVQNEADVDPTRNIDKVERQNYLETQMRLKRYVGIVNDLPINTLWLAHAMISQDENGNDFRMPMFHGKGNQIAMWVAAQMHCYGYLHVVDVQLKSTGQIVPQRRIQWDSTPKIRAKDRFDCLGDPLGYTKNSTLRGLQKIIEDSAGVDDEPPKKAPAKKVAPKKVAPTPAATTEKKEGNQ